MDALKGKRQSLKGSITRIYNTCSDQNISLDAIRVRIGKLDELYAQYESVQDEIDALTDDSGLGIEEQYRNDIEGKFFSVKKLFSVRSREEDADKTVVENSSQDNVGQVLQAISETQNSFSLLIDRLANGNFTHSSPAPQTTTTQMCEPRLPTINIPDFDGTYSEWIRFRDLFEALIDKRSTLSNVEKLEYLQTKLKSEALTLIKHLKPTNDNYTIAWELLKSKFNDSEHVKLSYFRLLFDQPSIKSLYLGEVKRLSNNISESINALKVLEEPVEHWDSILLFHLERKLDAETSLLWCRRKSENRGVTFDKFMKFLEDRIFELECVDANSGKLSSRQRNQPNVYVVASVQNCICCEEQHFLYQCPKFKDMPIPHRIRLVHDAKLCLNCLRPSQFAANCKGSSCRICNSRHYTLLHNSGDSESQRQQGVRKDRPQICLTQYPLLNTNNSSQYNRNSYFITLLPTAIVMIQDGYGQLQPCRALLDSGAQATLISESCSQRLNLPRKHDRTLLYGIGHDRGSYTRGIVDIKIASSSEKCTMETRAYILSTLTRNLPSNDVSSDKVEYFRSLKLADNLFYKSSRIDVIMGADIFSDCILPGKITHPSGSPIAMNTRFGWTIMGKIDSKESSRIYAAHASVNVDELLQRFWTVDDLTDVPSILSEEEKEAENHYQRNVSRTDDGRYIVRLPLKEHVQLGESKSSAHKRLLSMERRFILMPNSTTTKLRVVFDGSCKTDTGYALNDKLLIGPTIQNDIFTIILKFRERKIGYCADIEKMYRQVLIHPSDRKYQCILWRDSPDETMKTYHLNTVTYGTSATPFLAVRTLHQIALDNADTANVAECINQNFYVDDFMSCSDDLSSAIALRDDLCNILSRAGFRLRKWASNCKEFMESISPSDRGAEKETSIDVSDTVKTLGLSWDTETDCFIFSSDTSKNESKITKRVVLSAIAKMFDPIGWISPVVISMKVFMQKLWLQSIDWDQELPQSLRNIWTNLRNDLNNIFELRIPRWIGLQHDGYIELHGFADSSESAYAAVVYLRIVHDGERVSTSLIASKTRVAPIKQISLPRLELCAAQLLVRLMIKVQDALKIDKDKMYGWSDSMIVLTWISDHPRRWKNYIANRTSFIIDHMPSRQWRHIRGKDNPADLATRGISTSELKNSDMWWHGPNQIRSIEIPTFHMSNVTHDVDLEERNNFRVNVITKSVEMFDIYSQYGKLLRITALIRRFIHNCKLKGQQKVSGFLASVELRESESVLIRKAQHESYSVELRTLQSKGHLPDKHKLCSLAPFVDDNGLMRVGGRLNNANISYDQKHPLILQRGHKLSELIVRHVHRKYLHAGLRQTMYIVGLKFWIPGAIYEVKRAIYKCTTCMREKGISYQQQMAALPHQRLQQCAPFVNTGVDYAGPFYVRSWKGLGARLYKTWISVFVCLGTKAIHLELVTELSTSAFIAAFRRFVARRGKPAHMYSDNGTNFVGCNQHLRELYRYLNQSDTQYEMQKEMSGSQITWHFSPPSAPHFGGIWEASVKSTKYHLKRVLTQASVTFEEMYTILCQVEG